MPSEYETAPSVDLRVPSWLTGFIDDAAVFPPDATPLDRAVTEHLVHRSSGYRAMLGGFVVTDVKVPDLIDVLDGVAVGDGPETAIQVNLVVTGGAGAIGPAVRWVARSPLLHLRAIEFALRDEDDLTHNARRVRTALDTVEEDLDEVAAYVELPRISGQPTYGWLAAMDELADADLMLRLRTGGGAPESFPTAGELATAIDAALDRELPFRCAGALTTAVSGDGRFGFANLLLATRACLDGGDTVGALTDAGAGQLLAGTDPDLLERTRRWFTGFSSNDVLESYDDLVDLGLITPA